MTVLREERDAFWWWGIATHPEVETLLGVRFEVAQIAGIVERANVLPLASEHGGFWFVTIDSLGRVAELHTLYKPEGWGREVHGAAKAAFNQMFAGACEMIVTQQMRDNPRSQPPKSFGFRPLGDFTPSHLGDTKTWILTREAWAASPGGRSSCH